MKTRKKVITLTTICLLSIQSLLAQIPAYEWARQIGGTSFDQGYSIAVDTSRNVYITGDFSGTVDFDPGLGTAYLTSALRSDIFVLKLDAHGNFLWAKRMGGLNLDHGSSITVDPSGNVYTIGSFSGTVDFDPGVGTTYLTSAGITDIFIQKLDTDGNFLWAKQMGGTSDDIGYSIALDAYGNIYTTGGIDGIIDYSLGTEFYDIFIQKLDNNGDILWAKQMGGTGNDKGLSLAVDFFGNVYTTGLFYGKVDFDPGTGEVNLTSAGSADIFILKLDTDGNFLWAKQMVGKYGDIGYSIALDTFGNVYTTGHFYDIVDFDPGTGIANLTSAGSIDIFVQKLDTNGDFLWAKQMGGTNYDIGYSLAIDASANVYTTGSFSGTVDFDPGLGTYNLISDEKTYSFIQKLDTNGDFVWAKQMGGHVSLIDIDASGNIYTTGAFSGIADFDPEAGESILTSLGNDDIFVQKLHACYPTDPVPDIPNLPDLNVMCEITSMDAPAPTATSNCVGTITATINLTFPITDRSITQIVWTYDDNSGNVVTQDQTINWIPIDVTTSLNVDTISANNWNGAYQWLDCDNDSAPLAGENERLFIAKTSGNYAVEITEECRVDTSECVSIVISSIREFEHYEKLVVSPNPSTDNFKVEFGKVVKNAVLEVTDIHGKLVFSKQIQNSSETSIELNETPGIYLLTIKSKENFKTIQLMKK